MKVLIPVDDSECSWEAVNSVSGRIWPRTVKFRIVTVVPFVPALPQPVADGDSYIRKARQGVNSCGQALVDEVVAQLKKHIEHAEVSGHIIQGSVTQSIIQEATEWIPDLIVMGSHEYSKLKEVFLGGVAHEVSKRASCPVEIVQQTNQPEW